MDGTWIQRPQSSRAIVFVHGILAVDATSWRNDNGTYWPALLAAEPEHSALGVYVFSYETGLFSGSYRLSNAVDDLKEHMRLDGVTECREIVFVCHSMGGLVGRKYLVERALDLVERQVNIGLFLIASPSLGSNYANWLSALARLVGHSQADALRFGSNNPWLRDLDKEFQNLKESRRLSMRGKELVEDKSIVLRRLWRKPVVEEFSAARYFGEPYKVPGSDHFSIATPPDRHAVQHRLLCDFIAQMPQLTGDVAPSVADGANDVHVALDATPRVNPLKTRALLDRRLVNDLLLAFGGAGWTTLEPAVQATILYGLAYYDQLLVENLYASTLHHRLLANPSVPKPVRDALVVTTPVPADPFLSEVMSEAAELFAMDPGFSLAVSVYQKSKGGSVGSATVDMEYVQHSLQLARGFDAAVLPHPQRWLLYRTCFENPASGEDAAFSDTVVTLPAPSSLRTASWLAAELRDLAAATEESSAQMELRQLGPCRFPYPKALLRSYDKTDIDALPPFVFEFCVPGSVR
jgi:pimeloyl-ACP methyl ester carboxylesterase